MSLERDIAQFEAWQRERPVLRNIEEVRIALGANRITGRASSLDTSDASCEECNAPYGHYGSCPRLHNDYAFSRMDEIIAHGLGVSI